ncbi:MAG: flagellar basal body-associated FliL family protein [Caldimonas sp.]
MSAVMADLGDDAPIRRPGKKRFLIGAAVLLLVLALGIVAVMFLKQRAAHAAAAADDESYPERAATARAGPRSAPTYLPLDPFVVNLTDREADRYAQIGITLELDSDVSVDQIKAYMPSIRNSILMILAHKSSRELLSREGKEQLASDVMRGAVRPMGIELALPEPITAAPPDGATSAVAAAARLVRPRDETQRNPIRHVHFSSFLIQ